MKLQSIQEVLRQDLATVDRLMDNPNKGETILDMLQYCWDMEKYVTKRITASAPADTSEEARAALINLVVAFIQGLPPPQSLMISIMARREVQEAKAGKTEPEKN